MRCGHGYRAPSNSNTTNSHTTPQTSVTVTFGFFADTVAPAWRSAWKYDKELALACCAWFDFSPASMARLREINDEEDNNTITWVALELKTWDQAKVATFVEALKVLEGPPELLEAEPDEALLGLVNEDQQAWQHECDLKTLEIKRNDLSNQLQNLSFLGTFAPYALSPGQLESMTCILMREIRDVNEIIEELKKK
jgi:hypothetical protein